MNIGAEVDGRFGKQDFIYLPTGGCLPMPSRQS